ncbi:MAG: hypothetical protein WA926_00585 [Methylovirgula sp.]
MSLPESDERLRVEQSRNESLGQLCGAAVIVGLLIEVGVAIAFRAQRSFIENWAPVGANALIALGVFGEILFDRRALKASATLQRISDEKVAKANERAAVSLKGAATARLELKKLSSPREFNFDNFWKIMGDPRAVRARAEILYVRDCPDCMILAGTIRLALLAVKWEILKFGPLEEPAGEQAHLPSAMAVKAYAHGVTVVGKALAFLPFENSPVGDVHFGLSHAMRRGVIGAKDESMPDDLVRVVVAPRP